MAPYQLTIAYDGTDFCGFQRQKNRRSVQQEIENSLRNMGWSGRSILSAGRTDAGVHADGQVIAFDLDWSHRPVDLVKALNGHLPSDISVKSAKLVSPDFNPRFDARERKYRYQVVFLPVRDPIHERYFWRVWPEPDHDLLLSSTEIICGQHDFKEFGRPPKPDVSTVRTIYTAKWNFIDEEEAFFTITSKAFLYHMVRRIVFLLVRVGQGRIDAIELEKSFEKNGKLPTGIAPARGLFLEEVNY
jgi:tRNA pseudouridine38-40 synthase